MAPETGTYTRDTVDNGLEASHGTLASSHPSFISPRRLLLFKLPLQSGVERLDQEKQGRGGG